MAMTDKELRKFVVERFEAKQVEYKQLISSVEAFCVSILIDCKTVLTELDSAKKVINIIIDEIDDRTNTGVFDPVDGALLKGLIEKLAPMPMLEEVHRAYRNRAIKIIEKERTKNV